MRARERPVLRNGTHKGNPQIKECLQTSVSRAIVIIIEIASIAACTYISRSRSVNITSTLHPLPFLFFFFSSGKLTRLLLISPVITTNRSFRHERIDFKSSTDIDLNFTKNTQERIRYCDILVFFLKNWNSSWYFPVMCVDVLLLLFLFLDASNQVV